ncbi:MAG: JAB domain-containing protein [Desulfobacteraceae bacterium]|nr:JAB domain-containing protein [Desulfobacteraceae bacterium]
MAPVKGIKGMIVSQKRQKVFSPGDVCKIVIGILSKENEVDQDKEHFWVFGLNGNNLILYIELVSLGILNRTLVHPREVFRMAILKGVNSVILAHNHPGGSTSPSLNDIAVTKNLKNAGKILGIKVLDHVIVSNAKPFNSFVSDCDQFYSFDNQNWSVLKKGENHNEK